MLARLCLGMLLAHAIAWAGFVETDVDQFFDIKVGPQVKNREGRQKELRAALLRFLTSYEDLLGEAPLRERLADLAANHLFESSPGKIPVHFFEGTHPHNFPSGFPYPLLVISEVDSPGPDGRASLEQAVLHEGGHLVLGKFNDGMAEPIANLMFRRSPAPFHETEALAALQLQLPDFRLKTLFSYLPGATHALCEDFRTARGDMKKKWRERLKREFSLFQAEMSGTGILNGPPPEDAGGHLYAHPNPNEGPWAARNLLYALGSVTLNHLLTRSGGKIEKVLRFYYSPTDTTLRTEFGMTDGFATLERELRDSLEKKYASLVKTPAWAKYTDEMAAYPCFQKTNWPSPTCLRPEGNPARPYPSLPRESLKAPPSPFPPMEPPAGGFSVSAFLGKDWNLEKWCSGELSSGEKISPLTRGQGAQASPTH